MTEFLFILFNRTMIINNLTKHKTNLFLREFQGFQDDKALKTRISPKSKEFFFVFKGHDIIDLENFEFFNWFFLQLSKYHKDKSLRTLYGQYYKKMNAILTKTPKTLKLIQHKNRIYIEKTNKYGYVHQKNVGRIYSESSSLQSLPGKLKGILLDGYTDYDLVSSSFSILLSYAKRNDLQTKVPLLTSFVESKDGFVKKQARMIMDIYYPKGNMESSMGDLIRNLKRVLKRVLIIVSNILPERRLSLSLPGPLIALIYKFQDEVHVIREHIASNSKCLHSLGIKTEGVKSVTIQNAYVHTMESKAVLLLMEELKSLGVEYFLPTFDGVVVTLDRLDFDLENFNDKMRSELELDFICFSEKEFEKPESLVGLSIVKLKSVYRKRKLDFDSRFVKKVKDEQIDNLFVSLSDKLSILLGVTEFETRYDEYQKIVASLDDSRDIFILSHMKELDLDLPKVHENIKELFQIPSHPIDNDNKN